MAPAAVPLALLALLASTGTASAALALETSPSRLAVDPGSTTPITLRLAGSDDRGGTFDLFVDGDGLDVTFRETETTRGIFLLPGQASSWTWTPTVHAPASTAPGARDVAFRLLERPGPPDPKDLRATLPVRIGGATPSAAAPGGFPLPTVPFPAAAVAFAAATVLLAAAAAGAEALRRRGWPLLALYWRVRGARVSEHPVRAAILTRVRREPGVSPADVQRDLALSDGQMDHHLRRLVRSGFLLRLEDGGRRRLYLPGQRIPTLRPLPDRILETLSADRARVTRDIAEEIGVSAQLARYHLEKLRAEGRLVAEPLGMRRAYRLSPQA